MKIYVFGNEDNILDNAAIKAAKYFISKIENLEFTIVKPNEDLPFSRDVVLMDVVQNIEDVTLINFDNLDNIVLPPRLSAHDFDVGFQLKYLKKLGKLGKVKIIGLPMYKEIDYLKIQSILRKLVAQDMQGS